VEERYGLFQTIHSTDVRRNQALGADAWEIPPNERFVHARSAKYSGSRVVWSRVVPTRNSSRRRPIAIAIVSFIFLASIIGWLHLRVDSSHGTASSRKQRSPPNRAFPADSSFASKVILWLRLKDGVNDTSLLYAAADDVEKRLDPSLHQPRASSAEGKPMRLMKRFRCWDYAGELLVRMILPNLESGHPSRCLEKTDAGDLNQLTQLQGSFFQPILRKDPLGVSDRILGRLYALDQRRGLQKWM